MAVETYIEDEFETALCRSDINFLSTTGNKKERGKHLESKISEKEKS